MALQINGTTVVNNSRQLQNIASLDTATTATISAAAGGEFELPPYENNSTDREVEPFIRYYSNTFGAGGFNATAAGQSNYYSNTTDNLVICRSFGGVGGSNQWMSLANSSSSSKKLELFTITSLTTQQMDSNTVKTGPDSNGFYKYSRTVPANTGAFVAYFWWEPTIVVYDVSIRWQAGIDLYCRSGSGRAIGFVGIQRWRQGDVGF